MRAEKTLRGDWDHEGVLTTNWILEALGVCKIELDVINKELKEEVATIHESIQTSKQKFMGFIPRKEKHVQVPKELMKDAVVLPDGKTELPTNLLHRIGRLMS